MREYLKAWFPIIGSMNKRCLIIDGFAGPGTYEGDEPGSPIIALETLIDHSSISRINDVTFAFIEAHAGRHQALIKAIDERFPSRPANVKVISGCATFEEAVAHLRDRLTAISSGLAPAFVMVDPFGVKGVRFEDLQWILSQPKCEVYLSFMGSFVSRFVNEPEFEPHLNAMFGSEDWRPLREMDNAGAIRGLNELLEQRLRDAGARYVVRFDLFSGNAYKYSIFFASKSLTGCAKMKEAIWKAMPTGSYRYVGDGGTQLSMDLEGVDLSRLDDELIGRLTAQWSDVGELEAYLQGDGTRFHPGQMKRALKGLEQSGKIEADPQSRQIVRTYPPGTKIRRL